MHERYEDRIVREALEAEERRRRHEEGLRQSRQREEEALRHQRLQARPPRSNTNHPSDPAGASAFLAIILVFLAGFMIFTCAHHGSEPAPRKKATAPKVEPIRPRHRKHHARTSKGLP